MGKTEHKVYLISNGTHEYVGEYFCQQSPLEPGVFLIPPDAVEKEPPKTSDGEVAIWSGTEWLIKPDYRNRKAYSVEKGAFTINPNVDTYKDLWFSLPASCVLISDDEEEKINSNFYDVEVKNNKLILTLKIATDADKKEKMQELDLSCKKHIAGVFGAPDIQVYNLMLTLGEISLQESNDYAESQAMNERWYYYKNLIDSAKTVLDLANIKIEWN